MHTSKASIDKKENNRGETQLSIGNLILIR